MPSLCLKAALRVAWVVVLRQAVPWLCIGLFWPISYSSAQGCDEFCFCANEFAGPVLEENVPSNARILVRGRPGSRFVLRGMDGRSIALVTEPSSVRGFVWVSPKDPLPVRSKYMLEPAAESDADGGTAVEPDADGGTGAEPELRFRVSVVGYKDHTPPTATGFSIKAEPYTSSCSPSAAAATVKIDWISDVDNTEGYSRFYVLVEVTIEGVTETAVFRSFGGVLLTQDFGADNGCFFTRAIEHARPGVPASAVVSVLDQAGNKVSSGPLAFEFAPVVRRSCPDPTATNARPGSSGTAGAQGAASDAVSAAGAKAEPQPTAASATDGCGCRVAASGGTTRRGIGCVAMLVLFAVFSTRSRFTRLR